MIGQLVRYLFGALTRAIAVNPSMNYSHVLQLLILGAICQFAVSGPTVAYLSPSHPIREDFKLVPNADQTRFEFHLKTSKPEVSSLDRSY